MTPRRLALLALLAPSLSLADGAYVPTVLPMQGRLLDSVDQPVSGQRSMTFALYTHSAPPPQGSSEHDDQVWSDTVPVQLLDGVYAVNLGEHKPLASTAFAGDRFLSVSVDGVELLPRVRIGAVPYAFSAAEATHAGTADVAKTLDPTACLGCVAGGMIADGAISAAKLAPLGDGSGVDADLLDGHHAGDFAQASALADYAKTADLAAYAKTSDLVPYAKTTDLAPYAKTTDLAPYAKTADLAPYAKTTDLASVNAVQLQGNPASAFQKKTELLSVLQQATAPACGASTKAQIYFNSADNNFWGCNGTVWVKLGGARLGGDVTTPAASCKAIYDAGDGRTDGLYWLDPDGAGGAAPFVAWCDMTTDGGGWTLVFNHDITGGYFANANEALLSNDGSPQAKKYSMLSRLGAFRGASGAWTFRINWPGYAKRNIWTQTTNPLTDVAVGGYSAVDVQSTSNYWGGLELGNGSHGPTNSNSSLLDGSVQIGNWYYAIGSYVPWGNPAGIPASDDAAGVNVGVGKVQLWVR